MTEQPHKNRATRTEHDSLGALEVPHDALYAAQTQRAVQNFPLSGNPMPERFIDAVVLIKCAAARVNVELGVLPASIGAAIEQAAAQAAALDHRQQFPVDVFQTGSGTSTNMNVNEVLATLAARELGQAVHPNDHVNLAQSSNDVIPTAIHLACALALRDELLPALDHLAEVVEQRMETLTDVVKTGRTHLMDAMPLTMAQELSGWAAQIRTAAQNLEQGAGALHALPQGGTAVGTGINAHPQFAAAMMAELTRLSGLPLRQHPNFFAALSGQDAALQLSGQLKGAAVVLMKISNDLRWMNSGPLAGLGEIELPALQPGSSIMPGKVNPVVPEAVAMVAAQVIGYDSAITIAAQSGNFQLNVMLPLIASNLLDGIQLIARASRLLADAAVAGFQVRADVLEQALDRNPILATALNPVVGYQRAADIAKRAYAERRPLLDVAREMTELSEAELQALLNPKTLTQGGLPG